MPGEGRVVELAEEHERLNRAGADEAVEVLDATHVGSDFATTNVQHQKPRIGEFVKSQAVAEPLETASQVALVARRLPLQVEDRMQEDSQRGVVAFVSHESRPIEEVWSRYAESLRRIFFLTLDSQSCCPLGSMEVGPCLSDGFFGAGTVVGFIETQEIEQVGDVRITTDPKRHDGGEVRPTMGEGWDPRMARGTGENGWGMMSVEGELSTV